MSTKISKSFNFQSAIHFQDKFMINFFEMVARMIVETDDVEEQNTAIERMIYFLESKIEDCVFVHEVDTDSIEKYTKAGMKVCTLPEEPYDQIIGLCLVNKCNAIMEGRIIVEEIEIGSKLSNLIKFTISDEAAELEYPGKYWWNDSSLNMQSKKKKDKIVPLFGNDNWAELELTWKTK